MYDSPSVPQSRTKCVWLESGRYHGNIINISDSDNDGGSHAMRGGCSHGTVLDD